MTIERQGEEFEIVCDGCDRGFPAGHQDDFHEVLDDAKSKGWRAFRSRTGAWEHTCPSCRGPRKPAFLPYKDN